MEFLSSYVCRIDLALRVYREFYQSVQDRSKYHFVLPWIRLLSLFRSSLVRTMELEDPGPLIKLYDLYSRQFNAAQTSLNCIRHNSNKPDNRLTARRILFLRMLVSNLPNLQAEIKNILERLNYSETLQAKHLSEAAQTTKIRKFKNAAKSGYSSQSISSSNHDSEPHQNTTD